MSVRQTLLTASLALASLAAAAPGARADLDVIFLPQAARPAQGLVGALAALPGVERASPVFDAGEAAYLVSQGEGPMAGAVKLKVADEDALRALQARKDLPGRFELNPRARLHSLNPEQWGLDNTGKPQEVVITDILSRFLKSVPGEDAGVLQAPAEVPGRKILVAVIDTGVELTHPALATQVHRTPSECEALQAFNRCMNTQADKKPCHDRYDNLDTDGNGYPLDCSGWDLTGGVDPRDGLAGSNEVKDVVGHGTHVSGIIAGTGFISGVASQVEILPVKVLGSGGGTAAAPSGGGELPDPHGEDYTQDSVVADVVARGVLYAVRSHAQVLNMSLGYSIHDDSELMRRMVALAQAHGVLVVAAAGNESSRTPVYPCRYPGVVCVASFSADGSISHFSDYGDAVDIAAPGYSILSAWPTAFYPTFFTERPGYDFLSGTSMASPFVAGALARLLNHGYSPAEAYARLILGARPSLAPSAMAELEPKFTLSGNLDLARAFAVAPQPLILPELKESVLVAVDRQGRVSPEDASFQLSLKNFWLGASRVDVKLAVADVARGPIRFGGDGAELARSFGAWGQGETRLIQGKISWNGPLSRLPGEFYVDVTVSGPGLPERTFRKSFEFVVPVHPQPLVAPVPADSAFERVGTDLAADKLPDNYAIKPVSCLPEAGAGQEDLLLILKPGTSTILQLLAGSGSAGARAFRTTGGDVLDNANEQLFAFSCGDFDHDGKRDYAVTTFSARDRKFTVTRFDSLFRHLRGAPQWSFSSEVVGMPEQFRWLESGAGLVPAFVARGKLPDSELPGFNPWETRPPELVNPADQRFYYLDQAGLHTIHAPEGYHFMDLLKPSAEQLRSGTASVILFKGTEFVLDYYVADVTGLRLGEPRKIDFSMYQRLNGLDSMALAGADAPGASGTVYDETGAGGRMRLSLKPAEGAPDAEQLAPWVLEPTKPGDMLTQLLAAFGDTASDAQAFSRSRFQLYFHDRRTGVTLGTGLKQYDSVTRHLPARVEGQPAMLLPEGQGASLTTELIVSDGRALVRPAALKTLGVQGCEPIQMKPTGLGGAGAGIAAVVDRLIYFCGDHFVEIRL